MSRKNHRSKAELSRLALQIRRDDLGLDAYQPLSPYDLAAEHGVAIYGLDDLAGAGCQPDTIEYFTTAASVAWSAALVSSGAGCFIVENTSHGIERRRSNVVHEMAHLLLDHDFGSIMLTSGSKGSCHNPITSDLEEEAAELGAELLLPTEAARRAAIYGMPDAQVAQQYTVSIELARWRMNATGARRLAERVSAKRAAAFRG